MKRPRWIGFTSFAEQGLSRVVQGQTAADEAAWLAVILPMACPMFSPTGHASPSELPRGLGFKLMRGIPLSVPRLDTLNLLLLQGSYFDICSRFTVFVERRLPESSFELMSVFVLKCVEERG